jgi:rhodanese-related sulfurtransferase
VNDDQLSPEDLKAALARGERPYLVDVREPWEFEAAKIPGSRLIPLGELHERLEEVDREKEVVLVCHHGVRSMHALHMLRHFGFSKLRNLTGGIDAFSDVDHSVPRY